MTYTTHTGRTEYGVAVEDENGHGDVTTFESEKAAHKWLTNYKMNYIPDPRNKQTFFIVSREVTIIETDWARRQ